MKNFVVTRRHDLNRVIDEIPFVDDEFVIVLENTPGRKDIPPERKVKNIYAFYPDGSLKWRIDPDNMMRILTHVDGKLVRASPFVWLGWRDDVLIADTFNGARYQIDPETGKATLVRVFPK